MIPEIGYRKVVTSFPFIASHLPHTIMRRARCAETFLNIILDESVRRLYCTSRRACACVYVCAQFEAILVSFLFEEKNKMQTETTKK